MARRQWPGLLQYLEHRLGSYSGSGPEYHFWCPMCVDREGDESSKRKLDVRIDSDGVKLGCFRCRYGTRNLERFFRDLNGGTLRYEEAALIHGEIKPPSTDRPISHTVREILYAFEETRDLKPVALPKEAVSLCEPGRNKLSRRRGVNYLEHERHVHPKVFDLFDIRYCATGEYAQRLIFPVYQNGEIVYFTSRYCGKHWMKSKNPPNQEGFHTRDTCLLNYDNVVGVRVVAVVEGPLDVMAHRHAVGGLGKVLSDTQVRLLQALCEHGTEEFVISLDSDAGLAGEAMYQKLLGRVPKVTVLKLDHGDPDDRREELDDLMEERKPMTTTDRVRGRLKR